MDLLVKLFLDTFKKKSKMIYQPSVLQLCIILLYRIINEENLIYQIPRHFFLFFFFFDNGRKTSVKANRKWNTFRVYVIYHYVLEGSYNLAIELKNYFFLRNLLLSVIFYKVKLYCEHEIIRQYWVIKTSVKFLKLCLNLFYNIIPSIAIFLRVEIQAIIILKELSWMI